MEDFKQKYEEFYYDFARPIIREQNQGIRERLFKYIKNIVKLYFVLAIIAIPILLCFVSGEIDIFEIIFILICFSPFIFCMFLIKPSNKTDEAIFKAKIMNRFLEVFGRFGWVYNNISVLWDKDYWENIIFPRSITLDYDDYIHGFFKDKIEISINEYKTEKLSLLYILPIVGWIFIPSLFMTAAIVIPTSFIFFNIIFSPDAQNGSYPIDTPEGTFIAIILLSILIIPLLITLWKIIPIIKGGGFHGLIVKCLLPKNAKGHTCVYEKNPTTNRNIDKTQQKSLSLAKLEDVEFNKEYCVYTDDQIEARYILTTAFVERFKKLKEVYNAKYIRAEFKDNKMLMIINTGRDLFNFSPYKKLSKKDFDRVFEELSMVFSLIDELKLDVKTGL